MPLFLTYSKYFSSSLFTSCNTLSCDTFTLTESVISCFMSAPNLADTPSDSIYSLKPDNILFISAFTSSLRLSLINFFIASASILSISKSKLPSPIMSDLSPKLISSNIEGSNASLSNIEASKPADISSRFISELISDISILYMLSSTLNALLIASASI